MTEFQNMVYLGSSATTILLGQIAQVTATI